MKLFDNLENYDDYLKENPIDKLLDIDIDDYGDLKRKIIRETYLSVDPSNKTPFSAEMDDLIRLHYLIKSRKVTTILEIGVGKSSVVFDNALKINKTLHGDFISDNLRRSNAFECHSIDNNIEWINEIKSKYPFENTTFHLSECNVGSFGDRICTFYENLPNICPDFIYLDAPDQFSPAGDIRGISTRHPDRLPISADILAFEHFLLPGTLIVIDGRTANARFLKSNLQRNWEYHYSIEFDQHFFELKEIPLGIYNQRQIEFCLGSDWVSQIS